MITIGTRFYPASADSERRQRLSRQSLLALPDAHCVNLQFTDETFSPDGFDTRPVLRHDSRTVTGAAGLRKPIVSEMFDALAAAAAARGSRYFVYLNADIEVTPRAIDHLHEGRDGWAFCRVDLAPGTRVPQDVLLIGVDMFAIDVAWWTRHRARFRRYIAGEALWDNVYAAVLCSHGRAVIVDRDPGIFHEQHDATWGSGPYGDYNGYLAALDAPYFSRWARYVARRQAQRAADEGTGDGGEAIASTFSGPVLPMSGYPRHAARVVRAWARHAMRQRRHRA